MYKSILIAGSGGQGVLFLGRLIAQGAMFQGYNVTWFPSYGAEVRGGTANCTVVISDEPIGSPVVGNPDILVVMNEASKGRFEERLKSGGLMVMDSSLIKSGAARADVGVLAVPATAIAASLGNTRVANMVVLGVLLNEGLIAESSVMAAIEESMPISKHSSLERNKEAIGKGKEHGGH